MEAFENYVGSAPGRAVILAVMFVGACGRMRFDQVGDAVLDSSTVCPSWGPFSAPSRLAGPAQTASDDWFPTPSSNELELYFYTSVETSFDIVRSTRATRGDLFSAASSVSGVNSSSTDEKTPTLTEDGLVMVFSRLGSSYDLIEATRSSTSEDFGSGASLTSLNTETRNEISPWLSPDGLRLLYVCDGLICESSRSDRGAGWETPFVHTELQHGDLQDSPTTTADGLDMWFAEGVVGDFNIYTAHRPTLQAQFGAPTPVLVLDSSRDDLGLRLSHDGATMYLNYDALFSGNGNADLWTATRACLDPR